MSDLDVLVPPEGRTVALPGGPVTISPLKIRQLGPFTRALAGITPELLAAHAGGPAHWVDFVAHNAERLQAALAVATDLPEATIGDLELDRFIELALAVLEVNADFFEQRLALTIAENSARLQQQLEQRAGRTSSSH